MEYLYAETENEVAELLGFPSRGTYYIPSDIIISRYLPDYHEVVRFMIRFTQDDLGLYIEPFVERGLACMLGGRFGQTSDVMPQIARFTLANDVYVLDDVLTFDGFHKKIGNVDFSFPLSLGLVETLTNKFNITGILGILTSLSGSADEVHGWSSDDVKAVLTKFTGKSWTEFEGLAKSRIFSDPFPNLKPGAVSDSGLVLFESGTSEYHIRISLDDGWYNVWINRFSPDAPVEGAVVLTGAVGHQFRLFRSFLWAEQFPEVPYSTQIYSIIFNEYEVGIYDYLTNRLIAKYVAGFDEKQGLVSPEGVFFRFEENVLRGRMDSYVSQITGVGTGH